MGAGRALPTMPAVPATLTTHTCVHTHWAREAGAVCCILCSTAPVLLRFSLRYLAFLHVGLAVCDRLGLAGPRCQGSRAHPEDLP